MCAPSVRRARHAYVQLSRSSRSIETCLYDDAGAFVESLISRDGVVFEKPERTRSMNSAFAKDVPE